MILCCDLSNSELLLKRCPWDVVDAIRLLNAIIAWNLRINSWHLPISNQWHCATAIGCLWSHGVQASDHCNDATVKKDESNRTDGDNSIKEDRVLWLPFDVTVFIDVPRCTSCTWSDQNHAKLDEQ